MVDWRTRLGEAVGKAFRATAFLAMALGVAVVVAPITRSSRPESGATSDRAATTVKTDDDEPQAKRAADPRTVMLDADAQTKNGIATSPAASASFREQVPAYAVVLPIDRIVALYNASLTSDAQLAAARAKQANSRVANERAQTLYKTFTTAQAQAQAAAAAEEIDTAGVATVTAQAEALRNTARQEWGPVLGDAIVARKPLAADLVRQRTRLVQISAPLGHVGAPPTVSLLLSDGSRATGRLVSEAAQVDPKIQAVGYLYEVPASPGLVPGTGLIADLPKRDAQPGFDIPPSSVVWQAGKPWIYLRVAPDRFERRPVGEDAAPTAAGGYVLPATSLAGGATALVTTGAQVLLSQEMRSQIPTDGDD